MSEVAVAYVSLMPSARGFKRRITEQIGPDIKASGTSGGRSYGASFKKGALGVLKGIGKTLVGALGVGTAAVGTSILQGMAGQAVALVGGLSQAAGAAGLIPGVLAGGVAVLGTFAIGLNGIDKAFKALATGDPQKLADAVKGLAPSAQDFIYSIQKAKPALKGIRNAVQENLFKGLGPIFGKALTDLGPIAKTGFSKIASGLNSGLRSTFQAIDIRANLNGVSKIFSNVAVALHNASGAAAPLVNSVIKLTSVSSSFLPRLGTGFSNLVKQAAGFINKIASDGSLQRWIGNGMAVLKQLGGLLKNVGSILGSVLSAGASQGRGLITSLQTATGTLAKFLKSAEGKTALSSFFSAAAAGASLLAPLLKALAPVFSVVASAIAPLAQAFGPILVNIIQALTPGITALVQAVGPLVAALGPALIAVATALSAVVIKLSPLLLPLGLLIGAVVTAVANLVTMGVRAAPSFQPLIGLVNRLTGAVAPGAAALLRLGNIVLKQVLIPAVQAIRAAMPDLMKVFNNLAPAVGALAKSFGGAFILALQAAIKLISPVAAALVPLSAMLGAIATKAAPAAPAIAATFLAFKGIKAVVGTVSDLKDKVTGAYQSTVAFKNGVVSAYQGTKSFVVGVKNGVSAIGTWIQYARTGEVAEIARARAIAATSAAWVKNTALVVVNGVRTAASTAVSLAAAAASRAMAAGQWLLNVALSANPIGLVVIAIAALVTGFILAYKNSATFRAIVQAALNAVKIAAMGVASFFTSTLPHAFMSVVSGLRTAWGAAVGFLKTWGPVALAVLVPFIGIPLLVAQHFGKIKGYMISAFSTAVAWLKGVPGQIKAALGNLGGLLKDAGIAIIKGFLDGLKQEFEDVKNFVGGIAGWIHDHKGPLTFDRQLLIPHGQAVMAGFLAGLERGFTTVRTAIQKFTNSLGHGVNIASSASSLTSSATSILSKFRGENGTIAGLNAQNIALGNLTRTRAAVAAKLAYANGLLVQAQQRLSDKAEAISQGILGSFNISALGTNFKTMSASLGDQITQARHFLADLVKLKSMGLSKSLIDQLATAGPAQAAAQAAALASATKGQISEFNAQYGQLSGYASSIGMLDAKSLFQSGVDAAKGLVAGLKSQEAAIDAQMARMGSNLIKSIKKALGIKSPAKKLVPVGQYSADGIIKGTDNRIKHLAAAGKRMADAVTPRVRGTVVPPLGINPNGLAAQYQGAAAGDVYHIHESTSARQVALEIGRQKRMAGRI